MINRIFVILDQATGDIPIPEVVEDRVYYSIFTDPEITGALETAYTLVENSSWPLSLAVRAPLPDVYIRAITSFMFMPSYLRIGHQPVLLLLGDESPVNIAAAGLRTYWNDQGIRKTLIYSVSGLLQQTDHYNDLLKTDRFYGNDLFYYLPDPAIRQESIQSLLETEKRFQQQSPSLYRLAAENLAQQEAYERLLWQQTLTRAELDNQYLYAELLRSDHQAKEIQDFYNREYESLPLWYKRLGHIVKVLSGKRTFRSLFRDDVKKYKD